MRSVCVVDHISPRWYAWSASHRFHGEIQPNYVEWKWNRNTDQIANSRIYGRRGSSAILHRILSLRYQWIYIYWKYAAFRCTVRSWSLCLKKFSVRNSAQFCGYRFLKNIWHGRRSRSFLGRLPKVDLIILEGGNVRPYVRPYVRPSVHKKFLRFEWNLVYR